MSSAFEEFLLSLPFSRADETVSSPRYFWDNSRRGDTEFVIIQWTLEGSGIFAINGEDMRVPAGNAFLAIVPEESCYYYPRESTHPWRFCWLNIYGSPAASLFRSFRNAHGPILPLARRSTAGALFLRLVQRTEERVWTDRFQASSECYAFLMEWARQFSKPQNREDDPVSIALSICRSRFREPVGTKELAAATGLTREHLTRLFTARTGISPGRYLRNLRLEAARQMLTGNDLPLKEVALRSGFPSVRSLSNSLVDN